MNSSYWSRFADQRVGRRRALAITGGTALGAAFLAACGGDSTTGSTDKSSLVAQPEDTFSQAKRGGTLRAGAVADPSSLDPSGALSPLNPIASNIYSTLVREKAGYLSMSKGEIEPDIAESWEWSPDRLQITMKIRQGVKWHNKAPVNGRTLDVDDVIASWNRFSSKGSNRSSIVNSINGQAPVLSLTATDANTIVIKLKEPLVYALELFASYPSFSGNVIMTPKETDNGFDARSDMIGTGPFYMANYAPSQGFTLKRHAEHYNPDFALVDQLDLPIVPEYATMLAQHKAGNIHVGNIANQEVRADDILSVKSEEPRLQLYATDLSDPHKESLTFGLLPDGRSPFLDERVRQAVSMSWDRDAWIEAFYNVPGFESAGLPVEMRWNTTVTCNWDGWWIDPKGTGLGDAAKYYQLNVAEAKKLLAAAGHADGLAINSHYVTSNARDVGRFANVLDNFTTEAGFKITIDPVDYAKDYIPNFRDGQGKYEGWAWHSVAGGTVVRMSPVSALAAEYWSKSGVTFKGFSTTGKYDKAGDPALDSLLEKARIEGDVEKRKALIGDVQKYLAQKMYGLIEPGAATGFTTAWPSVRNFKVYGGPSIYANYKLWLDQTQAPFV